MKNYQSIYALLFAATLVGCSGASVTSTSDVAASDSELSEADFASLPSMAEALATEESEEEAQARVLRKLLGNAAVSGTVPTMEQLLSQDSDWAARYFFDVEDVAAAQALQGSDLNAYNLGRYRCMSYAGSLRALDAVLGADESGCVLRTLKNNIDVEDSGVTLTTEGVDAEKVFKQARQNKLVRMTGEMNETPFSFNVLVYGSATVGKNYKVKTYMCQGDNVANVDVVELDESTKQLTITRSAEEDGAERKSVFSGKLQSNLRKFVLDEARSFVQWERSNADDEYDGSQGFQVDITSDGTLTVKELVITRGPGAEPEDPVHHLKKVMVALVQGTSFFDMMVPQASFAYNNVQDPENGISGAFEFQDDTLVSAEIEDIETLRDAAYADEDFFTTDALAALDVETDLESVDCSADADIEVAIEIETFMPIMNEACQSISSIVEEAQGYEWGSEAACDVFEP